MRGVKRQASRSLPVLRASYELPEPLGVLQGVRQDWKKWLNRRARGKTLRWDDYENLLRLHPLLLPRIVRPWVGAQCQV